MRALLIICLFPFVAFCMGKGRTFCGDGQRLAFTFAPLAASRACGCRERVGEKASLPICIRWENAGRCDGRCSVLRWLMERAARTCTACSLLGCGKLLFPIGRACSPVSTCLQPSLDVLAAQSRRACSLALARLADIRIVDGNLPWKACGRGASFYLKPSSLPPFFLQR